MRRLLKTMVGLGASFALALTLIVTAPTAADAAPKCDITYSKYHSIKKRSKGKQAGAVECLLKSAGYKPKMNRYISKGDVAKLKRFQKRVGLPKTGSVGARTWTALLARGSKPALRQGKDNGSVKRLQRALTASGRYVPATGYYGSMTSNAVKSVQAGQGWKKTGRAGSGVWRVLQNGKAVKKAAAKKKSSKKKKTTKKKSNKSVSSGSKGAKALAFAKKQLGDSYGYGASGPNTWDCSGLTGGAWKAAGVKLPRTSQAQYNVGKKVSKSNLKKGDLVFFYSGISHVGIYAGNGKVVHASRPGKPVETIKMKYMPYMGARRPG